MEIFGTYIKDEYIIFLIVILIVSILVLGYFIINQDISTNTNTNINYNVQQNQQSFNEQVENKLEIVTDNDSEYHEIPVINPTINILPAEKYDIINQNIIGGVQSTTRVGDVYNSASQRISGSDYGTVYTSDMVPKFDTPKEPEKIIDFVWSDIKSGKCYIPILFRGDYSRILLKDCSENYAKYRWINGSIQHIMSGNYLRTWNNSDLPENDETLAATPEKINEDRAKFDFLPNGNIIHRTSQMCIQPKVSNGNILLSLKNC
jgi:hypothetical protein